MTIIVVASCNNSNCYLTETDVLDNTVNDPTNFRGIAMIMAGLPFYVWDWIALNLRKFGKWNMSQLLFYIAYPSCGSNQRDK